MAFPKLLQKLFQNNGAGDKLNESILPTIPEANLPNKYLPLSGGDMTGSIYLHKSASDSTLVGAIQRNNSSDTGGLDLFTGSSKYNNAGACMCLKQRGATSEPGYFVLKAQDNSNASRLEGRPNGDLYWRGNKLLDSANCLHGSRIALNNGTNNNLDFFANDGTGGGFYIPGDTHTSDGWVALLTEKHSGNVVSYWHSGSSWYRKYADGFIMQGGCTGGSGNTDFIISLPIAFSNTQYVLVLGETTGYLSCGSQNTCEYTWKRTNTSIYIDQNDDNSAGTWWIACGY